MSNTAVSTTNQPQWELVYSTDYSALYRDATGVYPPVLCIAQTLDDVDEDDIEATAAVVYRFPLDRCWRVIDDDGTWYLTEQNPADAASLPYPLRSYAPWYAKHLGDVSSSIGCGISDLIDNLCSDSPAALAQAYEAIGGYHGFVNFDESPDSRTASEFEAWPELGVKLSTEERDAFTAGYIECALWCGVMTYKHDEDCPCHGPSENGDAYDEALCECDPELISDGIDADQSQLTDDARRQLTEDASEFYASNAADLRLSTLDMGRAGHDFWLTRNRHGAGFWDEGYRGSKEATEALQRLTEASHTEGDAGLLLGADTKITHE
jgi:hypothetical protein